MLIHVNCVRHFISPLMYSHYCCMLQAIRVLLEVVHQMLQVIYALWGSIVLMEVSVMSIVLLALMITTLEELMNQALVHLVQLVISALREPQVILVNCCIVLKGTTALKGHRHLLRILALMVHTAQWWDWREMINVYSALKEDIAMVEMVWADKFVQEVIIVEEIPPSQLHALQAYSQRKQEQ